jgi:hypothetical protein
MIAVKVRRHRATHGSPEFAALTVARDALASFWAVCV